MNPNRIRLLRKRIGMTQAEFGLAVGRSASAIALYELGMRTPPLGVCRGMVELAGSRGIDMSLDELVADIG